LPAEEKERIILAPGVNGSELMKTLATHGINCFNLRICGAGELARLAMMRSGLAITEDFIDSREEVAVVAKAVKDENYFANTRYSDLQEIARALRTMRCLATDGDEACQIGNALAKGDFKEKNNALFSVYKKYKEIIAERKLVDSVSLIRRAAEKCDHLDADFYILTEYPLNPLEKTLLEKLSGGKWREETLESLFHVKNAKIKIEGFKNCYGFANEVETIIADIYKSGKNLDKCTVAVTDAGVYGQLFFDCAVLNDIPVTFGCGIPIVNSNPARLLSVYHHWMTDGFFGADALNAMLFDKSFNHSKRKEFWPDDGGKDFRKVLAGIRLTNDENINKKRIEDFKSAVSDDDRKKRCVPYLEKLALALSQPVEDFIRQYAFIREDSLVGDLDRAAAVAVYEELKIIRAAGVDQATEDIISHILKKSVSVGQSEGGKLFVTDIDGALSSVRENLYIAGLSASKYPGSPKENYLLLDTDLKNFGDKAEYMTSAGRIETKRNRLLTLARLASGTNAAINVSFAGMNVSELKRDNKSSLVFELYKEMMSGKNVTVRDLEKNVTKIGYFAPAVSVTGKIGEAYVNGKKIAFHPLVKNAANVCVDINKKAYSPSELEIFFSCRRRFMLKYVLGIPEPDDDRIFETIAANETGILSHSLLEELANSDISKKEFLNRSEELFDRFIKEHPPLVEQDVKVERGQFVEMMETAYDMDPHRETVLKEDEVQCTHESGIKLHGYPDRVEKLDDSSYWIVDFKSKRKVEHKENDIDTCLQIMIYAYLMEKGKGFKVSGGEFRYIRLGKTVKCRYDEDMKKELSARLSQFKECLETGDFPIPKSVGNRKEDTPDPCKFCKLGDICGKDAKDMELGDD